MSLEAEGDTTGEVTVDSVRFTEALGFRATSSCKEEGSRKKEDRVREGKKGQKQEDRVRKGGRMKRKRKGHTRGREERRVGKKENGERGGESKVASCM